MAYIQQSRRSFVKQVSLIGAVVTVAPVISEAATIVGANNFNVYGNGFTFLFQGDSITDGNRSRNLDWNHVLGHGYAYLIAAKLWCDFPEKGFHFFNRGISGNKVTDLAARWQEDTIAIKPDVLSILIGINDINAAISGDDNFTVNSYLESYRSLLLNTRTQFPDVTIVICEPFILPVGKVIENWEKYHQEIEPRQKAAKELASEFSAIFVPLQEVFNKALTKGAADYWIWDGIHPMPGGHELIAREWIKQVKKELKFLR